MLSLFPQILFLAPFSALLIRLTLVILLSLGAWHHMSHRDTLLRTLSILEVAAAAALFIGVWVQPVAIAAFLITLLALFVPKMRTYSLSTTLLTCVLSLSLIVTGAGALAFDLPL